MSIVFTRRPPTDTSRRRGAAPDCPPNRLRMRQQPVKTTPADAAASLKNCLRLVMAPSPMQCISRDGRRQSEAWHPNLVDRFSQRGRATAAIVGIAIVDRLDWMRAHVESN